MYELIQVSESCYYVQCPAKIGLITVGNGEVCLIDSGNGRDTGKKILKILKENNWSLKAIYNTHSHADHIGGNRYLQEQTGCRIFAAGIERDFTEHPILESSYLFGGYPPRELRHKFLLAQESRAEMLTEEVLPEGLEIIPLPGHFFDMVGFRHKDGVVYLADCLSSEETLTKYGIGVLYDVAEYINTLEKVKETKGVLFIPSHAEPTRDIRPLADFNINAVRKAADRITELCGSGTSFDMLLRELFREYSLTMTFEQYALVGSTVRSYLAYLMDTGRVSVMIENNTVLWKKAD